MELDNASAAFSRIQLTSRSIGLRSLQPGQILTATVVDTPRPGNVTLQINGIRVDAQTLAKLVPGQQITVKITTAGQQSTLEIIAVNKPAETLANTLPASAKPPLITVTDAKHGLSGLGTGQRLYALVIDKLANGSLLLQLHDRAITARLISDRPITTQASAELNKGQLLELVVTVTGRRPTLTVQAATDAVEMVTQALRTALPRQNGLPPLVAILTSLLQSKGMETSEALPKPVLELARNILDNLPNVRDVSSATQIKKALFDSGVFFEHKLLQGVGKGAPLLGNDIKAELLKLVDVLMRINATQPAPPPGTLQPPQSLLKTDALPLPPLRGMELQVQAHVAPPNIQASPVGDLLNQLLNHVDAALARLQISQLSALPVVDQPQVFFTFELPLRWGERVDVVQLRIEQEKSGKEKNGERVWTVQLTFDLEYLGPIYVRVNLQGQQISTRFWAEQAQAADLFRQYLSDLETRFAAVGLSTGTISCHIGRPPGPVAAPTPALLKDLEA